MVCYLILNSALVSAVVSEEDAYEALRDFDIDFWNKWLCPYGGLGYWDSGITKSVTEHLVPLRERDGFRIVGAATEEEKVQPLDFQKSNTPLDFSEANFGEVIFNFYRILQCKVDSRDEEYVTEAEGGLEDLTFSDEHYALNKQGKTIDPYFTQIIVGDKNYHLHLDYDGGDKIKNQPGNCCLMQDGDEAPQAWCCQMDDENPDVTVYNSILNGYDHYVLQNLLLGLEVSRRKVVDLSRPLEIETEDDAQLQIFGFEDKFCDLPVLGAIIVGLELMNDEIISRNDFFAGKYRCFSNQKGKSEKRKEHIKNLLLTFCQYKNFQTVEQFLETVDRLYKQFIGRKITEEVLDSSLDEYPEMSDLEPERKRRRGEERENLKGVFAMQKIITGVGFHIVDIANNDDNFLCAISQCLNPDNRYLDMSQKDEVEELRQLLCEVPEEQGEGRFIFTQDNWLWLEDKLECDIIVCDATSDDNCVFSSDDNGYTRGYFSISAYRPRRYKENIILLWRGDRWQAVLPNQKTE